MLEVESLFAYAVRLELESARRQHGRKIHSLHEGYAVILEEMTELQVEVFNRSKPFGRVCRELIQVAAMCHRMAEDLGLDPYVAELTRELERKRDLRRENPGLARSKYVETDEDAE